MANIQILTIITPSYEKVGREMIRRVKKFTGHEVKVIECPDSDGFWQKLNLDKHAGRRRLIFMDADLWPLRKWNPEEVHLGDCIQGCWDHATLNPHAFPHTDCHKHGLQWDRYLNTGLLMWDNRNSDHREIFKVARQSWKEKAAGRKQYSDWTDQAHLNFGIQQSRLPVQLLPESYNCYLFGIAHGQRPYIPREIINLHGAGIPAKKKYSQMRHQAMTLGYTVYPMHQDAVNWEHAKLFNMR
jgi:hypothetical protein